MIHENSIIFIHQTSYLCFILRKNIRSMMSPALVVHLVGEDAICKQVQGMHDLTIQTEHSCNWTEMQLLRIFAFQKHLWKVWSYEFANETQVMTFDTLFIKMISHSCHIKVVGDFGWPYHFLDSVKVCWLSIFKLVIQPLLSLILNL